MDNQDLDDDQPGPLDDLIPPDPLMAWPWWGCVRYTLRNDQMMKAFREETGLTWTPGTTGLERMIDEASGADIAFFRAFLKWHNENVWGDINLRAGQRDQDDQGE